jgi:hypothetical protein
MGIRVCHHLFGNAETSRGVWAIHGEGSGPSASLAFPFENVWKHARAGKLKPGDIAPDFTLLNVDESESVRLASLQQKEPVMLVFGSRVQAIRYGH